MTKLPLLSINPYLPLDEAIASPSEKLEHCENIPSSILPVVSIL